MKETPYVSLKVMIINGMKAITNPHCMSATGFALVHAKSAITSNYSWTQVFLRQEKQFVPFWYSHKWIWKLVYKWEESKDCYSYLLIDLPRVAESYNICHPLDSPQRVTVLYQVQLNRAQIGSQTTTIHSTFYSLNWWQPLKMSLIFTIWTCWAQHSVLH